MSDPETKHPVSTSGTPETEAAAAARHVAADGSRLRAPFTQAPCQIDSWEPRLDRAEPAWRDSAIRLRQLNVAADIGHARARELGGLPNYRSLPKGRDHVETQKADGLPIEMFYRQALVPGAHAVMRVATKFQKATVPPTSPVLSIEPPVGSRLWSMPNLLCQYT
jgi:hypothetical protein